MAQIHPVEDILDRWPDLKTVAESVNEFLPNDEKIEVIAVRRWRTRKSIPGAYDLALLNAASKLNIPLNWRELMLSRSRHVDQGGHGANGFQRSDTKTANTFGNPKAEAGG